MTVTERDHEKTSELERALSHIIDPGTEKPEGYSAIFELLENMQTQERSVVSVTSYPACDTGD